MFIGIESLNLLEQFFQTNAWIALINSFGVTIFQSFFYNAAAFFLYSLVLSTLYQKKPKFFRYALASIVYCLLSQGMVFAISILRPEAMAFHIEDLFVVPPPYFILIMYILCVYFLQIDRAISLVTATKLYPVIVGNVIAYYMLEAALFYFMTNSVQLQMAIYFFANSLLFVINAIVSYVLIWLIKRNKLWLDAYKIKKSTKNSLIKDMLIYIALFAFLWLVTVPTLKLISYLGDIVIVEIVMAALFLICALIFYISYSNDVKSVIKADLDNQTTHVHSLIGAIDNIRTLKHDMHNMLSVYDGYVRMGEWDKLLQYNSSLQNEARYAEDLLDINATYTINPILRTLLSTKIEYAHEKGVHINTTISVDSDHINMDPLDLARITGILLDNAIEETIYTDTKSILFAIQSLKKEKILLSISNPTRNDVEVKKIMEKNFSSKEGHSGLGLYTLWNIVNKTPGCRLSVEYFEKVITFYLELSCARNNKPKALRSVLDGGSAKHEVGEFLST